MPLRPLERGNFVGDCKPASGVVADGGQATYSGHVFTVLLPRAVVAPVIPAGFALAQRKVPGHDHPVMCLLGTQSDCSLVVGGHTQEAPQDDYEELIVLIPYVVKTGSAKALWHTFCVRMYLDQLGPIVIGDFVFQYSKNVGTFTTIPFGEEVRNEKGVLGFTCIFNATSPLVPAAAAMPGFGDFLQVMQMPILGVQYGGIGSLPPPPPPPPPDCCCSYFEWDGAAAMVSTIESAVCFTCEYRPGMAAWVRQPPDWTLGQADASFAVDNIRWRLATTPPACEF
jgi:hypothetical protein